MKQRIAHSLSPKARPQSFGNLEAALLSLVNDPPAPSEVPRVLDAAPKPWSQGELEDEVVWEEEWEGLVDEEPDFALGSGVHPIPEAQPEDEDDAANAQAETVIPDLIFKRDPMDALEAKLLKRLPQQRYTIAASVLLALGIHYLLQGLGL